jgi:hypothetical protein
MIAANSNFFHNISEINILSEKRILSQEDLFAEDRFVMSPHYLIINLLESQKRSAVRAHRLLSSLFRNAATCYEAALPHSTSSCYGVIVQRPFSVHPEERPEKHDPGDKTLITAISHGKW